MEKADKFTNRVIISSRVELLTIKCFQISENIHKSIGNRYMINIICWIFTYALYENIIITHLVL